jgi:peroxiredoxin
MVRMRVGRRGAVGLAAVVVVAFAVAVFAGVSFSSSSTVGTLQVGAPAPAWSGVSLTGAHLSSAGERGRWVVLNFFATWCDGCREETPQLEAFVAAQPAARVAVVSVLTADSASDARSYAAAHRVDWPILTGSTATTMQRYKAAGTGLPETFVIAPDGRLVSSIVGAATEAGLDRTLATPGY